MRTGPCLGLSAGGIGWKARRKTANSQPPPWWMNEWMKLFKCINSTKNLCNAWTFSASKSEIIKFILHTSFYQICSNIPYSKQDIRLFTGMYIVVGLAFQLNVSFWQENFKLFSEYFNITLYLGPFHNGNFHFKIRFLNTSYVTISLHRTCCLVCEIHFQNTELHREAVTLAFRNIILK